VSGRDDIDPIDIETAPTNGRLPLRGKHGSIRQISLTNKRINGKRVRRRMPDFQSGLLNAARELVRLRDKAANGIYRVSAGPKVAVAPPAGE